MSEFRKILEILGRQDKRLKNIEKFLQSKNTFPSPKNNRKKIGKRSKSFGLRGAILELKDESFFKKPKELKEIKNALEAKAVFHPRTNYPRVLLNLVTGKELRRLKQNNKWKYVNY